MVRVETTAAAAGGFEPSMIWFGSRRVEVHAVSDRWYGATQRWWKVETDEGSYVEQHRCQRGATRDNEVRSVLRLDAADALDDVRSQALERAPCKTFGTVGGDIFCWMIASRPAGSDRVRSSRRRGNRRRRPRPGSLAAVQGWASACGHERPEASAPVPYERGSSWMSPYQVSTSTRRSSLSVMMPTLSTQPGSSPNTRRKSSTRLRS